MLCDAMQAHGVLTQPDGIYRFLGSLSGVRFFVALHPKRFYANLCLRMDLPREVVEPSFEAFSKVKAVFKRREAVEDKSKLNVEFHNAVSAAIERLKVTCAVLNRHEAVQGRLTSLLVEIGMVALQAPLEEELAFIGARYGADAVIRELIGAVREERQVVMSFLSAHDFEQAEAHRDRQKSLLGNLYDLCVGRLPDNTN